MKPRIFVFRRDHLRFNMEQFLKYAVCSGTCFLGPRRNRGQYQFNFRAVTDKINIQAEPSIVLVFKDDILWEDDSEDKDDSDWMTDNDSFVSDDGESDE